MKQLDIKRALDNKGLTIKELSERLGITYNGARLLVTNARNISSLEKIASAIGCDITDLFFSNEMYSPFQSKPLYLTCPHCGKPISIHIEKGASN